MINKMMLRKKAMEMAMREKPTIAIAIKSKKMPEDMMSPIEGNDSEMESSDKEEGFEQMAVTPSEKKMILEMRANKEGSKDENSKSEMNAEKEYA